MIYDDKSMEIIIIPLLIVLCIAIFIVRKIVCFVRDTINEEGLDDDTDDEEDEVNLALRDSWRYKW